MLSHTWMTFVIFRGVRLSRRFTTRWLVLHGHTNVLLFGGGVRRRYLLLDTRTEHIQFAVCHNRTLLVLWCWMWPRLLDSLTFLIHAYSSAASSDWDCCRFFSIEMTTTQLKIHLWYLVEQLSWSLFGCKQSNESGISYIHGNDKRLSR